jgi:predicted AlkP superfamily pyrophosphatase or phosphodiesterase
MRQKFLLVAVLGLEALLASTLGEGARPSEPRLLLLLSIDQGRAEYLERFRPALEGGLAYLLDRGVVFANAHHHHANTSTGPGHASLATGAYPRHSGIVRNNWYDRTEGRRVYCVEDADAPVLPPPGETASSYEPSAGRGPKRLLVTGLGDWVKENDPGSKVYSAASKDRASVLMGAKRADGAFWLDLRTGQWVTSRYYMQEYPQWMIELQQERLLDADVGRVWMPLPIAVRKLGSMDVVDVESDPFPRIIGQKGVTPDSSFYNALNRSPFVDENLFELAKRLVQNEALGRDETVDVLALSFGSIDFVGHEFGPNSRELFDAFIRLDRELGAFFRFLDDSVGLEHVAIALSADHGVAPLPEYQAARKLPGRRLTDEDRLCLQNARAELDRALGQDHWFVEPGYFDYETLRRHNVRRNDAENLLVRKLEQCSSVASVWTRSQIESAGWADPDGVLALYFNGFYPDRSPDLYLQLKEGYMSRKSGTTHGSPYDYDTHVPMVVLWPHAKPRVVSHEVYTVDLPVTLAALLGIMPPESVDGVDRSPALR